MKRLILLSVVIVAAVFVFGLSMGWFHVVSHSADGKSDITLTVDKDKIEADKDNVVDKVQDLGRQARDKAAATTPR